MTTKYNSNNVIVKGKGDINQSRSGLAHLHE